jgi:hypothetical protein
MLTVIVLGFLCMVGAAVRLPVERADWYLPVLAVLTVVVGSRITFPIYLYSALRFPSQLPQVIAVAVVVLVLSLTVVIAAEVGRRIAERRLGAQ